MGVKRLTHDTTTHDATSRTAAGLLLAVASATSFGLSGALARGLLDTGWSAGATVALRIGIAALVLVVPGALALRGQWHLLRTNAGLIGIYGIGAVAGAQLCFFYAVTYMQVSVALLLEYTAPVAVVVWLWLRHGQRPSRLTLVGGAIAAAGLVLVLDVVSGADLSTVGVLWALAAMLGVTTYFIISADEGNGLPGISLAAGGLVVGGAILLAAGASGILPFHASSADAVYDGRTVAWWIPVVALGLVTAAFSYVTGIAAGRRLGSRLASFVALGEVLAAVVWAWLLLGELPRPVQLAGGLLVLAGVVVVKLGEGRAPLLVEPVPDARVSERPAA
ncbi:Threonine/homoserine efflux transporter RhtA [Nocardioides exalbidus]|uniref:Threonine/homoserine efflux transporter RhtA n=1 Tax=Nocardioides exalbidus TaxID=402596 RepID=A0A1H4VF05_9ACTN|nr:Threonine/homoserine efflux transporter RhtA [Nocardioides exalbidus]